MDYREEQTTEIALIQSVYPDETEVLNDEYPHIQIKLNLPSQPVCVFQSFKVFDVFLGLRNNRA